jgi:hypothetical protein
VKDAYNYIRKSDNIPGLYATEPEEESQEQHDPLCRVKLFTPDSNWSWYIIEHDPDTGRCFGYVVGFEAELGYFNLKEIEAVRGPLGLQPERDLYWKPTPLSELV